MSFLEESHLKADSLGKNESGVWSPDGGLSSRPSSSDDFESFIHTAPLPPTGPYVRTGAIEKIFATYGFIVCRDGNRYFFHFGTCVTKPELLIIGDEVDFILGPDKRSGRTHAQRVFRHRKEGEASVEARIPYSRFSDVWMNKQGKLNPLMLADSGPTSSPHNSFAYPNKYKNHPCPMSAPIMNRNVTRFSFDHAAIVDQLKGEREKGSGIVGAVMTDGSLVIELIDHSRLVMAQSKNVTLEEFKRGSEVAMEMTWKNGRLRVDNVRLLSKGALTSEFVRGGEKLNGRVVKELTLGFEETLVAGLVETSRKAGEEGSVRRYPFTLISLEYPRELSQLSLGSTVSFHIQAEGGERRAVSLRPNSNGDDVVQTVKDQFATPSFPSSLSGLKFTPSFGSGFFGNSYFTPNVVHETEEENIEKTF